jgi:hypothetical protein
MNQYGLSVREQRWPWLLTAGLMLVAAAATGRSTYLYWLPCRGSMLKGSIINYYVDVGRKFPPRVSRPWTGTSPW